MRSSYCTPPAIRPASEKSGSSGQTGWNETVVGEIRLNSPTAGVPPTWRMLIEFRLTVLKLTGLLNSTVIGRLMNQTLLGATFRLLTWKSLPPPEPPPPPPPQLATIEPKAKPKASGAICRSAARRLEVFILF